MAETTREIPRTFQDVLLPRLPYAEGDELTADADLAALGLDSMGVVQLLADLEDRFGVELDDELLTEETFATVGSLWATVADFVTPELAAGHE
ncbi:MULTISPECIES: phosphopantetheine-binding protein [unclassified Streptomyces]|uniref:phosphopantetheine-binding protein n=1 Tax=unclassified Streptomyces TaxID=2593676 RepID=UPI001661E0CC|nr:phosphopantetheine-binding protein [Streptomyces sp. CBMA29]MBD0738772.1 phosphopantetheine-binding protein [Streptomyces sp. CBMA29]WSS19881.1 phosphopantetheine-binding protein [Streptomyces sp. NBC_01190]